MKYQVCLNSWTFRDMYLLWHLFDTTFIKKWVKGPMVPKWLYFYHRHYFYFPEEIIG